MSESNRKKIFLKKSESGDFFQLAIGPADDCDQLINDRTNDLLKGKFVFFLDQPDLEVLARLALSALSIPIKLKS